MKILVIGDAIIDHYIDGSISRISPEAPIPIFSQSSSFFRPGGALNVFYNILSLGNTATKIYFPCSSEDLTYHEVFNALPPENTEGSVIMYELIDGYSIPLKTRYLAQSQQVFRSDQEMPAPCDWYSLGTLQQLLSDTSLIVLSDYCKGAVTEHLASLAIQSGVPVVVDTKKSNLSSFKGAYIYKPNYHELISSLQYYSIEYSLDSDNPIELVTPIRRLLSICNISYCVVTLGSKGALSVSSSSYSLHSPPSVETVLDVTGAGDTFIASLACGISKNLSLPTAISWSVANSATVIKQLGTSIASPSIKQTANPSEVLGFTNGCFDILHAGHLSLLRRTREYCDKLIVGLNSDASIARIKGNNRPINNELARMRALLEHPFVDDVIVFEEDSPLRLIKELSPHILIKGGDYNASDVVGYDHVSSYGGRVVILDYIDGFSTTSILERANEKSR
ncbi:hypothetical protein CWE17_07135 [Synechococcus sp. BS56D]|uniref:PfkB family carbohydrate kinase n=1 Tax=Synechococcus sp. BS56D TaxID=2055944 RepID=UPI00103F1A96|nr:PfkB family carbohydrate kinase [Synechococcus sp. BS56D]TCD57610.1 hypothetical protein CWE17_07135 [Synechococcus sp. BS56D]